VGLPIGVLALDGKVTALPSINGEFAQTQHPEHGEPYGLIRTVTCALVSAAGRPCIDVIPIPAHTNEMGHFQSAFTSVDRTYGALFQMVTYDAGALSEANGRAVVEAGKDYLFALKNEHRTMFKLATELLAAQEVAAPAPAGVRRCLPSARPHRHQVSPDTLHRVNTPAALRRYPSGSLDASYDACVRLGMEALAGASLAAPQRDDKRNGT
jgi:hypothetical protein